MLNLIQRWLCWAMQLYMAILYFKSTCSFCRSAHLRDGYAPIRSGRRDAKQFDFPSHDAVDESVMNTLWPYDVWTAKPGFGNGSFHSKALILNTFTGSIPSGPGVEARPIQPRPGTPNAGMRSGRSSLLLNGAHRILQVQYRILTMPKCCEWLRVLWEACGLSHTKTIMA